MRTKGQAKPSPYVSREFLPSSFDAQEKIAMPLLLTTKGQAEVGLPQQLDSCLVKDAGLKTPLVSLLSVQKSFHRKEVGKNCADYRLCVPSMALLTHLGPSCSSVPSVKSVTYDIPKGSPYSDIDDGSLGVNNAPGIRALPLMQFKNYEKQTYRRKALSKWKNKKTNDVQNEDQTYQKDLLVHSPTICTASKNIDKLPKSDFVTDPLVTCLPHRSIQACSYRQLAIVRWKIKRSASKKHFPCFSTKQIPRLQAPTLSTKSCLPASSQVTKTANAENVLKRKRAEVHVKKGRALLEFIAGASDVLPKQANCRHCNAVKMIHESANFCCSNGDVMLACNKIPEILKNLLTEKSDNSDRFKVSVRTYNNHLAFTSLGVKCDKDLSRRNKGIYTFKVQGQVYHWIESLERNEGVMNNLQLYFYDTEYELSARIEACSRLHETLLAILLMVLEDNPYARFFRSLMHVPNLEHKQIFLQSNPKLNQKVYNKPTVPQVSAILQEGEDDKEVSNRNIRVYTHGGHSRCIQYYYGCYDPLQYPLLFPYGEVGWHQGIPKNGVKIKNVRRRKNNTPMDLISPLVSQTADQLLQHEQEVLHTMEDSERFVSIREYYSYKFQIRPDDQSFILHFGRLFQQYVVDMYVKLETQRLDFYKSQQEEIRQEFLQGVADAVAAGETDPGKIGQRIILPASFTNGPRHMRRKYIDAMTLVQKFGKPDIFLTITSNPNWPEIKEQLVPGDEVQNRPDLIVRVFQAKLEELKIELLKKMSLEKPEEYDKIVSAEIPDRDKHPHLHSLVVKHMLHGPCGHLNPSNVCMKKNGLCKDSYPKEFCDETTQNSDAYPKYRRKDDGNRVKVRGAWLDNRWVFPYSPYLLSKFDCHINVEICSTIHAVKYIYKYICKGNDKILYRVAGEITHARVDEIDDFQSAMWISAPEALWRIYRFLMNDMKPDVVRLPLHLENYQPMTFKKTQKLGNILQNPFQRKTMLTEFFYMNRTSKDAQELNCTYSQFPDYFVWIPIERRWKLREKGNSVGRIVSVHPSEGERYYLRILLAKVRCPTSYDNLQMYKGVMATSFREAALNRGLLHNDNSQDLCLEEASMFHMPYELRRLFANILVYSCPSDPKKLWLKFESYLSEDYTKNRLVSHKC